MPQARTIRMRRAGFTLVEMLTVIIIVGLLMTMVMGPFFRTRTANKLLAAEQVLGDCIRQARHTARSTGSPVLLKLSPTRRPDGSVSGGVLSGVARITVWSEFFDHGQGPTVAGFTTGKSGTGRQVDQGEPWSPPELDRPLRFRPGDGAYLAISVRPPLAGRIMPQVPKQIPLMLVGEGSSVGNSSFGVMLVRSDAVDPRKAVIDSGGGKKAKMLCWEILGWVTHPKQSEPIFISSFDHLPSDLMRDRPKLPSGNFDIADPMGGDRWEDVGLLVTGDQMVLYRNGRRVAELRNGTVVDGKAIELPQRLVPGEQIWVGQADLGQGMVYAKCPLDDARVAKLGSEQVGTLPQGVFPMADPAQPAGTAVEYRILAHPEGRIELSSAIGADTGSAIGAALNTDAALPTGSIFLGGDFTRPGGTTSRGANSASITLSIDGRVSGALILVPEPVKP